MKRVMCTKSSLKFQTFYSFQTLLESHKERMKHEVSGITERRKSRSEERRRKKGLRKLFSMVMWSGEEEREEKGCGPKELEETP